MVGLSLVGQWLDLGGTAAQVVACRAEDVWRASERGGWHEVTAAEMNAADESAAPRGGMRQAEGCSHQAPYDPHVCATNLKELIGMTCNIVIESASKDRIRGFPNSDVL